MQLPLKLLFDFVGPWLAYGPAADTPPDNAGALSLQLRHLHASTPRGGIVFQDTPSVSASAALAGADALSVRTRAVSAPRPLSFAAHQDARRALRERRRTDAAVLRWDEDEILGPDVESRETLLTLAKMTSNAYYEPGAKGWYDLGAGWNSSYNVGWEPDDDGFRGYVFATPDNSTVVLSIKGTSIPLVAGGPTTKKDKLNDNLLFSCCCARVDWTWYTVCGCYRGGQRCDQTCVEDALIDESLFYPVGTNLYNNLTYMYPDANIWLIGHSLGGALASLLGSTFGVPVVAFEAPGERMAAQRLHLPLPPSLNHITHVYNTGDSIAMGVCTGSTSPCGIGGYALESRCHMGQTILYDTVANLSWSVGVSHHGIAAVVDTILSAPWPPAAELGREVPVPISEDECVDCFNWEYGDFPALMGTTGPGCGMR